MITVQTLQTKGEAMRRIAARYGVTQLAVFGSVARGEAGPDSDVDLLAEFSREIGLLDFVALKHALEDLLGVTVDLVPAGSLHERIRDRVEAEAITL